MKVIVETQNSSACFGSFTDDMLLSKLIKIYSIIVDSFLINSFAFLAKIPSDFT